MLFKDRLYAGTLLASALHRFARSRALVVALPRGGVQVARVVAGELNLPLEILLVKKIPHPREPELAIGAVVAGQRPFFRIDDALVLHGSEVKEAVRSAQLTNDLRRAHYFGGTYIMPQVLHKTVIVVDDGMATGLTMLASLRALRVKGASQLIVAVPVASPAALQLVGELADETVVIDDPANFSGSVSDHFYDFLPVSDAEVASAKHKQR